MVEDVDVRADLVVSGDNCQVGLLKQGDYFVEDSEIEIWIGFFGLGQE
jgi:hypothetical protein